MPEGGIVEAQAGNAIVPDHPGYGNPSAHFHSRLWLRNPLSEVLPRIFDPYFQHQARRERSRPGDGLRWGLLPSTAARCRSNRSRELDRFS